MSSVSPSASFFPEILSNNVYNMRNDRLKGVGICRSITLLNWHNSEDCLALKLKLAVHISQIYILCVNKQKRLEI